ncbi:hypothetical protein FRX31_019902, partial [Thalictrum thalictroides]
FLGGAAVGYIGGHGEGLIGAPHANHRGYRSSFNTYNLSMAALTAAVSPSMATSIMLAFV